MFANVVKCSFLPFRTFLTGRHLAISGNVDTLAPRLLGASLIAHLRQPASFANITLKFNQIFN